MVEFNARNARLWSVMGINPSVWSIAFPEILSADSSVVAVTADLGRYSGMMRTWRQYPSRFFNVGIAEQNLVGVAAGLAMTGHQVFMTTYAPFLSYRCADQMRHLLGNHNLNIKAIGSSAGLSAGLSGASLLALGDVAFMRTIPNMTIFSPSDCPSTIRAVMAAAKLKGPVYIRFCGTTNIPIVYNGDFDFVVGKVNVIAKGERVALLATGTNIVCNALSAAKVIGERLGCTVEVADFLTIKPIDETYVRRVSESFDHVFTIEEHGVVGGLGSAVSEVMSSLRARATLVRLGVPDGDLVMGKRDFMLAQYGLDAAGIVKNVLETIEND